MKTLKKSVGTAAAISAAIAVAGLAPQSAFAHKTSKNTPLIPPHPALAPWFVPRIPVSPTSKPRSVSCALN